MDSYHHIFENATASVKNDVQVIAKMNTTSSATASASATACSSASASGTTPSLATSNVVADASATITLAVAVKVADKPLPKQVQKSIALIAWQSKGKALRHNDYTENFEFCEDEIKVAFSKKSWNALDKCFKWQYIETYLVALTWMSEVDIAGVKVLFVQNKLKDVVFNNKERCIKTLNLVINGDRSL